MHKWGAARRELLKWAVLALVAASACGWAAAQSPPATALSPDERPTLLLVAAPAQLTIIHHAHPLPPNKAEQLALKLGLFIAAPIIRRQARDGWDPLPRAWQTDQPDRGFAAAIAAALDPSQQANWPWRALKITDSSAAADAALAQLTGRDVVIVTFKCELEDQLHTVQLIARANLTMIRSAGTPNESRTDFSIRHFGRPIVADWGRPRKYAAVFKADGPLDQQVSAAALDLSHALAVTVARLTTAAPNVRMAIERYGDLPDKPKCPDCRASDPVLREEPGRVWVAPARLGGAVLSLPVG